MDDLTINELKQLLAFYKQRASDLEFEVLKHQIRSLPAQKDIAEEL